MKKIVGFLVFMFTISACLIPSYAQEVSAVVSYNPENGVISVSGEASGNIIIKTLPSSVEESSITTESLPTDIDQIYSSGDYTYTFSMPHIAAYGKYKVIVTDELGNKDGDTFMYYDSVQADLIIPSLNAQATSKLLQEQINVNAASLGIDTEDSLYAPNLASASDILFKAFKPFTDSNDFYSKFNAAIAMSAMENKEKTDVEAIIFKYQQYLDIDYATDYAELDADLQKEMCSMFSETDFAQQLAALKDDSLEVSFKNVFSRTHAVANVRKAESWSEIRDAFLTDYNSVLGVIVSQNSDYSSNIESSVFIELKKETSFNDFLDLKNKFNDAVSEVISSNKDDDRGGSGGGGGRVSVSAGINPKNEYDATQSENLEVQTIKTSFTKPVLTEKTVQYSDVNSDDWEHKAVSVLGGNGIISGYEDGSFDSSRPISRAEFTKLIVSAFDIKANKAEFSDVTDTDWFYPYVSVAAGSGIVNGYDGKFNPASQISRQDAAVIIYRISAELGENYYGEVNFSDMQDISLYALTAVRGLGNAKIINGDEMMRFNPKGQLTRAEAAQLLYNFIGALAK